MPASYQMAAPLNEAELMSLLMASPVYQKLEQIKDAVKNGITPPKHRMEPGEYGYTEEIIMVYKWWSGGDVEKEFIGYLISYIFLVKLIDMQTPGI